jgi:hypothetical protein
MNWDAVGAIGEVLGAIGVIVTLGYLAVQTRLNTRAINASTFSNNTSLWQDWFLACAGLDTSEAFSQCIMGSENVDPLTFQKFWMSCRAFFLNFESQFYQCNQGVLDRDSFKGYERSLCTDMLVWPGVRAWWKLHRNTYGAKYVSYIDRLMVETETSAAHRSENLGEDFFAWKALLDGSETKPGT